jgi:sugar (pentulose or hexulose) kinase
VRQVLADVFQADVVSLSTPDAAALGAALRAARAVAPAAAAAGPNGGWGEATPVARRRPEFAGAPAWAWRRTQRAREVRVAGAARGEARGKRRARLEGGGACRLPARRGAGS